MRRVARRFGQRVAAPRQPVRRCRPGPDVRIALDAHERAADRAVRLAAGRQEQHRARLRLEAACLDPGVLPLGLLPAPGGEAALGDRGQRHGLGIGFPGETVEHLGGPAS